MQVATDRPILFLTRRMLVIVTISFVGLLVGASCVVLPPAVPIAVVGLAGLILLWTMPNLALLPVELAEIALLPFVFSITAVPTYYAVIFPDAPWISIRRIMLFFIVGLTLLTLAGSSKHRRVTYETLLQSKWLSIFMLGTVLSAFLSVPTSVKPISSISDVINSITNWYLPLLSVVMFVRTSRQINLVVQSIFVSLIFTFLIGAVEFFLKRRYLYLALPDWTIDEILTQNPIAPVTPFPQVTLDLRYRAISTFMVSLSWAEFAMMTAPLALQSVLFGRTYRSRLIGVLALGASVGSIALSGSRGGYVGFIGGSGLFLFSCTVFYIVRNSSSIINPLLGFLFLLLSVSTMASVFLVGRVRTIVLGGGAKQASDFARHQQWTTALAKLAARPVTGYGSGNAAEVVGWIDPKGFVSLDSYAINILVSYGVIGFVFFVCFFLYPIRYCFDFRKSNTLELFSIRSALASSIFGYSLYRITLNQTENNTLCFMIIGLTIAANAIHARRMRMEETSIEPRLESETLNARVGIA